MIIGEIEFAEWLAKIEKAVTGLSFCGTGTLQRNKNDVQIY